MDRTVLTLREWREKAESLFGKEVKGWKFKCAACGGIQTLQDFVDAKVDEPESKFYYSCIGRWVKDRGCNWTLGGLFQIYDTEVTNEDGKGIPVFEFNKEDN